MFGKSIELIRMFRKKNLGKNSGTRCEKTKLMLVFGPVICLFLRFHEAIITEKIGTKVQKLFQNR